MPEHWGYTRDGTQQPTDEKLYDAAKKACQSMGKTDDYRCIWGMYRKNWEREHGKELLSSPPGGGKGEAGGEGGGSRGGSSPASAPGITPRE